MIRAAALSIVLFPCVAHAHCYHHWAYPRPQPGCGVYARVSAPTDDKSWFVEITQAPPVPASNDDEARAAAIAKLRQELVR
jgi:hypothetical protein